MSVNNYHMFLISVGLSSVVPHLDLLISLIGAFASSALALMLPAIIDLLTHTGEGERITPVMAIKDSVIILVGFVGFITGTYSSLLAIIDSFGASDSNSNWRNITASTNSSVYKLQRTITACTAQFHAFQEKSSMEINIFMLCVFL